MSHQYFFKKKSTYMLQTMPIIKFRLCVCYQMRNSITIKSMYVTIVNSKYLVDNKVQK